MFSWFKRLIAKLRHKNDPLDKGMRKKDSAEIEKALRVTDLETWSNNVMPPPGNDHLP